MNAVADGFLFLSINGGPVTSIPVHVETDKIVMELWYGTERNTSACPAVRALIEGVLTVMHDQVPAPPPNQN